MAQRSASGTSTADLVAGFTSGFAHRVLAEHGVVSGLGVWLLLALLAPGADGTQRAALEETLGTDADDAAARAADLLDNPHPEIAQAVAVWAQQAFLTPAFDQWGDGLPATVARGAMPTQAEADAWTAEQTLGLINRFPVRLRPDTAAVLTSALATKITWDTPFDMADEPFTGAFAQAREVLSSRPAHDVHLADTAAAGRVAVHSTWSRAGLRVVSVVAEPDCAITDVHRAALEAATHPDPVDLFDVPLGAGHAWTLDESTRRMVSTVDRTSTAHAHLPAWDAATTTGLEREPWFAAAQATMGQWVRIRGPLDGRQSAAASYDRTGFTAAAVTAFTARLGAAAPVHPPRDVRIRHLEVRFDRPYAVVALIHPVDALDRTMDRWKGVPVFNAWVADPR
ncbi:MAG: hypothetical protein FWF02_02335 [Micrococcales bacterium]|nr:hypothetical protein [Micrococcales bacterium]MCL2666529.1 hypothetical protein [Micrococcales bacterium]